MLSRSEKEQRVIELYEQGKTIREIAQELHMSFADIGSIIRKFTKLDDANKPQEKDPTALISKDIQAFKLFSEAKRPVEVAIKLDLGADIVGRLYQQFWRLEGLYQLNQVYKETRRYLPSFLKLFKLMKEQKMMNEQDVVDALKFGKELPLLKEQFLLLAEEIDSLEYKKNNSKTVLSALQNQKSTTKNSLKVYQSALDKKIQNIAEAHKKLDQLENIKNNDKNYQRIEWIVEQKANDILANKKAILTAAIISVFAALKNEPEKQLVIYDLFYNNNNNNYYASNNNDDSVLYTTSKIMSSSAANPENYLTSFVQRKVFEISEKFYDMLLKAAVNNTIYPAAVTQQPNVIKTKNK